MVKFGISDFENYDPTNEHILNFYYHLVKYFQDFSEAD